MGLGDCLKCVKYLLFVFNFIFCLIGLAILAFGIFLLVSPHFVRGETDTGPEVQRVVQTFSIVIIVIGSIITILGFLGCCGAIFENRVLLVLFFVLLLLIFLCLVAIGIFGIIGPGYYRTTFERHFSEGIKAPENSTERDFVYAFQRTWKCCGWNGEKDYIDSGHPVPASCHHNITKPAEPCSKKFEYSVEKHGLSTVVVAFVTAAVALIGLIFSMMLCCAITDLS